MQNNRLIFENSNHSVTDIYFLENSRRLGVEFSPTAERKKVISIVDIETGGEVFRLNDKLKKIKDYADVDIQCFTVRDDILFVAATNGRLLAFSDKCGLKPIWTSHENDAEWTSIAVSCSKNLLSVGAKFERESKAKKSEDDEYFEILFYDLRASAGLASCLGSYKDSHSDIVTQLHFDEADPDLLISSADDGLVNVFDLKEQQEDDALQYTFNCVSAPSKIGLWSDEKYPRSVYAMTDDGKLFSWDAQNGDDVFYVEKIEKLFPTIKNGLFFVDCIPAPARLSLDHRALLAIATDSTGELSASVVSSSNPNGSIAFSKVNIGHNDMIRCAKWSHAHELLFTGGDSGKIIASDFEKPSQKQDPPKKRARY